MEKNFLINIDKEIRLLLAQSIYSLIMQSYIDLKIIYEIENFDQQDFVASLCNSAICNTVKLMHEDTQNNDDIPNDEPQSIIDMHYSNLDQNSTKQQKQKKKQKKFDLYQNLYDAAISSDLDRSTMHNGHAISIHQISLALQEIYRNHSKALVTIKRMLKPGWSLPKISKVVLSILIIGFSEPLISDNSIGHCVRGCVEIAKILGDKEHKAFINAILDKIHTKNA